MKLALPLAGVLLLACGDPPPPTSPPAATEVRPGPRLERELRRDAARTLFCSSAAITMELVQWSGRQGAYRASGCGQQAEYVVVCEADDVCGFVR